MLRYGQVHRCSCRFVTWISPSRTCRRIPATRAVWGISFGLFFQLSCNVRLDNECNFGLTLMTFEDFALIAELVLLARYVALPYSEYIVRRLPCRSCHDRCSFLVKKYIATASAVIATPGPVQKYIAPPAHARPVGETSHAWHRSVCVRGVGVIGEVHPKLSPMSRHRRWDQKLPFFGPWAGSRCGYRWSSGRAVTFAALIVETQVVPFLVIGIVWITLCMETIRVISRSMEVKFVLRTCLGSFHVNRTCFQIADAVSDASLVSRFSWI